MADSVQASHILVMYAGSQGSSASRSKEEALERIQMVAAEMANNDVDFADLAVNTPNARPHKMAGLLANLGAATWYRNSTKRFLSWKSTKPAMLWKRLSVIT